MFLLGVVGGDLGGAVDEVDGGLAPPGLLGPAAVGLLVLVEEQLTALQDHTDPVPGPRGEAVVRVSGVRATKSQVWVCGGGLGYVRLTLLTNLNFYGLQNPCPLGRG